MLGHEERGGEPIGVSDETVVAFTFAGEDGGGYDGKRIGRRF